MNVELIKLICAIISLLGSISYLSGSSFCLVHPKIGLTVRGYFYSVATGFGLISNCTMFYILVIKQQKWLERLILIMGGIFAFSGAVDTILKNFLSEIVQILLMLGGLFNVFAYSVLLLRSKVIMKRIVQLSAFFTMIGGGLIAVSAMLLTKSKQYFTLAQTLHVVATSCYFTGATLNLTNQTRVFHGYPQFGTKQYLKMILLRKLPKSATRNSINIQMADYKIPANQLSTSQGDQTPSQYIQEIQTIQVPVVKNPQDPTAILTPIQTNKPEQRKKATTHLPQVTIRNTMYNPSPSQRYSAMQAPLNKRFSFKPPIQQGFYI